MQGFTVLLVDNASTDGTADYIKTLARPGAGLPQSGGKPRRCGGFAYVIRTAAELGCEAVWIMDDDTLPEPDALAALLAADAAHGDGCGWLSSRALAPDGTDQPMNLQRKTMYRDIDGFDAAEVPAVMASFVSLFLRTEAVRQFGLPIAEFFIWSDDWEYTRRISRAKPCYVIPASRVVHAMQNPGVVNIARDVPARWARYRYFYRNDVVLYRREGLSGWLWLLAKDSWHTVQVLRDRQGCRAPAHKNHLEGLCRRGAVPPADTVPAMNLTKQICHKAAHFDAVAFDVFDTLIKRDVAVPTGLFRLMGDDFYAARIRAEREARAAQSREVTLAEIYARPCLARYDARQSALQSWPPVRRTSRAGCGANA